MMFLSVVFVGLGALSSTLAQPAKREAECASGWRKNENKCFKFSQSGPDRGHANRAREKCQFEGAKLPTILSKQLEDFLMAQGEVTQSIWIGLRKEGGIWRWPDGSILGKGYVNWAPGHPEQDSGCVMIKKVNKKWKSVECDNPISLIVCEKALE